MTTPATQKVLYLTEKQGDFAIRQADVPSPATGEILVRVQSAALNPVDWKIQAYGIFVETYPVVLGSDIAGTIIAIGDGVTKFGVGDRVYVRDLIVLLTCSSLTSYQALSSFASESCGFISGIFCRRRRFCGKGKCFPSSTSHAFLTFRNVAVRFRPALALIKRQPSLSGSLQRLLVSTARNGIEEVQNSLHLGWILAAGSTLDSLS